MNEPLPAMPLAYSTDAPRHGVRVWAAAVILLGGLGLLALGGCFLIGVMAMYTNGFFGQQSAPVLGRGGHILIGVLYLLSFASFAGAAVVIAAGLRGLLAIIHGNREQ